VAELIACIAVCTVGAAVMWLRAQTRRLDGEPEVEAFAAARAVTSAAARKFDAR
jgi:hypothetical protein